MTNRSKCFVSFGLMAVAACLAALVCNRWIVWSTRERVYDSVDAMLPHEMGLVLGTRKTTAGGYSNPHFVTRIHAAAELYHAGKVRKILVSGDNHVKGYDEPTDMKEALVAAGVPEAAITLDYAGFRTLDSVVRARRVFGVRDAVIVSERFHVERALFLADRCGLNAVAFAAPNPARRWMLKVALREQLARVKAVLDVYVLRTRPKFVVDLNVKVSRA
ncbi:MAG TPA: ElyC/SanA/YdcF family protein [Verrucomicrobiae bacterium]|nr:ElyC/SanA/YdcF family protein [Verrucomicrobiae bacterium]